MLSKDQLAVYYASYRHLAKMAIRNADKDSKGGMLTKLGLSSIISWGGKLLLRLIESKARHAGLDIEKLKVWGVDIGRITSEAMLIRNY